MNSFGLKQKASLSSVIIDESSSDSSSNDDTTPRDCNSFALLGAGEPPSGHAYVEDSIARSSMSLDVDALSALALFSELEDADDDDDPM